MNISVCIATHNGEKYLLDQMKSILGELKHDDEVVVVDDCSNDSTVEILQNMNDSRINIYKNKENMGHVFSFGRAISLAINDIVFMSDQDDIWIKGRVSLMTNKIIMSGCLLVSSNTYYMDTKGRELYFPVDKLKASESTKHLNNILSIFLGKTGYYGCAMVFRKQLTKLILPIPSFVESHDLWIALASNLFCSNSHLEEKTLIRRVHDNNSSIVRRSLYKKIWSRFIFGISIIVLLIRGINYYNK
jgi:glycosyltransferase involved in cell wall biosynthesis